MKVVNEIFILLKIDKFETKLNFLSVKNLDYNFSKS